jgi:hypothetical protein
MMLDMTPALVRFDDGVEFTPSLVIRWLRNQGVDPALVMPGDGDRTAMRRAF